jgi:hypothetical protein
MPEELVVRRLVCIGRRLSKANRLGWFWQDEQGRTYGWQKQVIGPAAPGSLYDVSFDAEGNAVLTGDAGPRYVGRLDLDDPRVVEWSAQQRLAEITEDQERRARRDARPNALTQACEPLRVLYRRAVTPGRRASLLAALIEEITR